MPVRRLGWLKDPFDRRDYSFRNFVKVKAVPNSYDMSESMLPVRDQGNVGSCVGFACANMKDYQESQQHHTQFLSSPHFIYYEGRKLEGRVGQEGMYIRDALRVLVKKGVPKESTCPYAEGTVDVACESPKTLTEAKKYRLKQFMRLHSVLELQQALYQLGPTVIGVPVFENWLTPEVEHTGVIPMPEGEMVGGHAVALCGYDQSTALLKFENSWTSGWGYGGFGFLPYAYADQFLSSNEADAWRTVDA